MSYGLCRFITEIKKISGKDFPAKTLYEMVICIQIYLETLGVFWKLLNDSDLEFIQLKYMCDNIMKEHASSGIGGVVCQAEVLSYEDEDFLWENNYLRSSNPEQLLRI